MNPQDRSFRAFLSTIYRWSIKNSQFMKGLGELALWFGITITAGWLYSPSDFAIHSQTFNGWWILVIGAAWTFFRVGFRMWQDWNAPLA